MIDIPPVQRVWRSAAPILLDADKPEIWSTEIRGNYGLMHLPCPDQVAAELHEQRAELDRLIEQVRQQDSAQGIALSDAVNTLLMLMALQTLARSVAACDVFGQGADVLIVDWPEGEEENRAAYRAG